MTIGQIAKQSGVGKDAVRYYTTRGLVSSTPKKAGTREYADYSSNAVEQIKTIKKVQHLGFTLAEIKLLLDELTVAPGCKLSPNQLRLLEAKLQEIASKQKQLRELSIFIQTKVAELA